MNRKRRFVFPLALVAAVLVLATSAAAQDDEEAIVIGQREKLETFGLETPHGSVDLIGEYTSDKTSSPNSPETADNERLFQETLTLSTTGYIYHPNLVDLNLSGTFGLEQDTFSGQGQNSTSDSTVYAWDARATVLRNGEAPLTLYTDRSQNLVNQSFGPTLQDTTTTYGADLTIRSKAVPTDFRLYQTSETQTGLDNTPDYGLTQDVFQWHSEANPTPNQHLVWDYSFDTYDQTTGTDSGEATTGQSQSASLTHSIAFGSKQQNTLSSTLGYTESTEILSQEQLRWDELLRLRHTHDLETNYEYTLTEQTYNGLEQDTQQAQAGFRHKLYQSLTTTGNTRYQDVTLSDGGSLTDWDTTLNFDYIKKVPYGNLLGSLNLEFDQQNNQTGAQPQEVIGQPVAFNNFQPIIVQQQNINASSVILRNPATGQIYLPQTDYRVVQRADGIEIDPVIGGPIAQNQPLLLDYQLEPTGDNEVTTERFGVNLGYDINKGPLAGLSPYIDYLMSDQTVSGTGELLPNSTRDVLFGSYYRFWDVTLKLEHETYDSTISPFTATRFDGWIDHRLDLDTTASLHADYTLIDYSDPTDRTATWVATGSLSKRFSRELSGSVSVAYLTIQDDLSGSTKGLEEDMELTWDHRQTEIYARLRNSTLDTDTDKTAFQWFQVGIRRKF